MIKYFFIIVWMIINIVTGMYITLEDYDFNFLNEFNYRIKNFNLFGKIISYLFYLPYLIIYGISIIIYLIVCGFTKIMTWHPNSKN